MVDVLNILVKDLNVSTCSLNLHGNHVEGARFSSSISSKKAQDFSVGVKIKRYVLHCLNFARVCLFEVSRLKILGPIIRGDVLRRCVAFL